MLKKRERFMHKYFEKVKTTWHLEMIAMVFIFVLSGSQDVRKNSGKGKVPYNRKSSHLPAVLISFRNYVIF